MFHWMHRDPWAHEWCVRCRVAVLLYRINVRLTEISERINRG
jgi:hypothetical protein